MEVPDLTGKTIKEADRILSGAGLEMAIEGSGIAYEQSPEAGSWLEEGSTVQVKFQNVGKDNQTDNQVNSDTENQ